MNWKCWIGWHDWEQVPGKFGILLQKRGYYKHFTERVCMGCGKVQDIPHWVRQENLTRRQKAMDLWMVRNGKQG